VLGRDRRLQVVATDGRPAAGERLRLGERGEATADEQLVPPAAVLVIEQHRCAGDVGAGRETRGLQLEQGLQPVHLGLGGGHLGEQAGQPDRLRRKVVPCPVGARRGDVPFVEDQVDHGHHVVEPAGALGARGQLQLGACLREGALGAGDPLAHGGVGHQESAGDLDGAQSADQAQGQRGSRLRREGRVAAEEDQSQDVVLDVVDLRIQVGHRVHLLGGMLQLLGLAAQVVGAPEAVDGAPLGGRHQPGRRVGGDPVVRPVLERGEQGVLGKVLGEVEVAREAGQRPDQAC